MVGAALIPPKYTQYYENLAVFSKPVLLILKNLERDRKKIMIHRDY